MGSGRIFSVTVVKYMSIVEILGDTDTEFTKKISKKETFWLKT